FFVAPARDRLALPPSPTRRSSDLCHASPSTTGVADEVPEQGILGFHGRAECACGGSCCDTTPSPWANRPEAERDSKEAAAKCRQDRKSTRLNSSHVSISYADFCLN